MELSSRMKYYLAPLEGVTSHIYRRAYHTCFCPMDKYFTPFLVPHTKRGFNSRERQEILPENNPGMYLVPQIMSNDADGFLKTEEKLREYGYEEVNLNLGCPSKTEDPDSFQKQRSWTGFWIRSTGGQRERFLSRPESGDIVRMNLRRFCGYTISIR